MKPQKIIFYMKKLNKQFIAGLFVAITATFVFFQNCSAPKMHSLSSELIKQQATQVPTTNEVIEEYSVFFDDGPTSKTNNPEFTVRFRVTPDLLAGRSTKCSINEEPPVDCTNQFSHRSTQDGAQTLTVQIYKNDSSIGKPSTYQWTLDQTAPVITVHQRPTVSSSLLEEELIFSAVDAVDNSPVMECKMDNLDWSSCSSPASIANSTVGPRQFSIRAKDSLGNVSSPEVVNWTYVKAKPTIVLKQKPDPFSRFSTPFFSFELSDTSQTEFSTFECRSKSDQNFVGCNGGISFQNLIDGNYLFEVRAKNAAGDMTETKSYQFTIDTKKPRVRMVIANNIPGPVVYKTLKFNVDAVDEGGAEASGIAAIECTYGSLPMGPCRDDLDYTFLASGEYEFKFVAIDRAGNRSETLPPLFWFYKVKPSVKFTVNTMDIPGLPPEKITVALEVAGDNFRNMYLKLNDDNTNVPSPAVSKMGPVMYRWDWDYHLPTMTVDVTKFSKSAKFEVLLSQDLRYAPVRQIVLSIVSDHSYDFVGDPLIIKLDAHIPPPSPPGIPTFAELMGPNGVLGKNCIKCHNSIDLAGGLDITDHKSLIGQTVIPGQPLVSTLYIRMVRDLGILAKPMPLDGFLDSKIDEDKIKNWIEAGAPNN